MTERRHSCGKKLDSLNAARMREVLPELADEDKQLMTTGGETDAQRARAEMLCDQRRDLLRIQKQANTRDKKTAVIVDDFDCGVFPSGCEPI